jgi:hypothetical protein
LDEYSFAQQFAKPTALENGTRTEQGKLPRSSEYNASSSFTDSGQYYALAQLGGGSEVAGARTGTAGSSGGNAPSEVYSLAAQDIHASDYQPTDEDDYYSLVQHGADDDGHPVEYSLAQNVSNPNDQEYSVASDHGNPKPIPKSKPLARNAQKVEQAEEGSPEKQGQGQGSQEFSLAQHLMALNLKRAAAAAQETAREANEDHHSYENFKAAHSGQKSPPQALENDYTSVDSLNEVIKSGACDSRASVESQGFVPSNNVPEGSGPYYGNIPEYLSMRGDDEPVNNGGGGDGDYNGGEGVYDHIDHNPYSNVD